MRKLHNKNQRAGMALFIVLLIVMAITIVSSGYIAKADRELLCGNNVQLRMQMDNLAQSAMVHARTALINPQNVDTSAVGYWQGDTALQIDPATNDYYDIKITRGTSIPTTPTAHLTYQVSCSAYRLEDGQQIASSTLNTAFRLDPCLALLVDNTWNNYSTMEVNGDMYCDGSVNGWAKLNGDVFASSIITSSNVKGSSTQWATSNDIAVTYPDLDSGDYDGQYYIGESIYNAIQIPSETILDDEEFGPDSSNPLGIFYCNGNMELAGDVSIEGMLVVKNDLTVSGSGNSITKVKLYKNELWTSVPALLVDHALKIKAAGLLIEGLAIVKGDLHIDVNLGNVTFDVEGALYFRNNMFVNGTFNPVLTVTSDPDLGSIQTWPHAGKKYMWSPVAGSFFKSIARN